MPAQEKLSPTEQLLAYIIGGGVILAMVALFLYGLDVLNSDYTLSVLLIGLALIVIGVGAWLYLLKPWEKFDDLRTPHYNGPEAHAHEHAQPEPLTAPVAQAEPEPALTPAAQAAPEPVTPSVAETETEPLTAPVAGAEPEPATAPAAPDDLTIIEGIGPKSAQALIDSGITTFAQVAAMTPEALAQAVRDKGVRLVGSAETWPEQARLAAAGDLAGLQALRDKLRGGRA